MSDLTPANLESAAIRSMDPAIVKRLRLVFPEKIFAIERCSSTMSLKEFNRHARQTPFLGLAWVGMKPDNANGRILKGTMQWRLFLIVSANDLRVRLKGDTRDIGMDAMVDIASAVLQGANLEDIGTVRVTGAQSIFADGYSEDDITIAQVDIDVAYSSRLGALQLTNPAELKTLNVTWLTDDDASEVSVNSTIDVQPEGENHD